MFIGHCILIFQGTEIDGDFTIIDASRTLEGESILTVPATMDSDTMFYTCGIQVRSYYYVIIMCVTMYTYVYYAYNCKINIVYSILKPILQPPFPTPFLIPFPIPSSFNSH